MSRHKLFTVDVFTTDRFSGNPLGVVIHKQQLSGQKMQSVAREINYSETTFVPEPAVQAVRAGKADRLPMRIFTPASELPFAGHPVVGTSWVLCERIGIPAPLRLDIPAGSLVVAKEKGSYAFDTPVPKLRGELPTGDIAAMAGIEPTDLSPNLRPQLITGGPAFVLTPVASAQTLVKLRPNLELLRRVGMETGTVPALYAFAAELEVSTGAENTLRVDSRMFFDAGGLREDPATGSAAAALGAYLRENWTERLPFTLEINQGVAMGRASLLRMRVSSESLRLSGHAVPVIDGYITI